MNNNEKMGHGKQFPPGVPSAIIFLVLLIGFTAYAIAVYKPAEQWTQNEIRKTEKKYAFKDGLKLYKSGDYAAARRVFTSLAKKGNMQAGFWLGDMDENGLGGRKDLTKAVSEYRTAANKGVAEARTSFGVLNMDGIGIDQNFKKARYWLSQAATDNVAFAQFRLGRLWEHGWGGEKNLPMAYAYYEFSARHGYQPGVDARDRLLKSLSMDQVADGQNLIKSMEPTIYDTEPDKTQHQQATGKKPKATNSAELMDTTQGFVRSEESAP